MLTTQSGSNERMSIVTEDNGGLLVKGLTSNGATTQNGLNGKESAVFEDVYFVNPPPRPGYAPRVNGLTLSWGHIGALDDNMLGRR